MTTNQTATEKHLENIVLTLLCTVSVVFYPWTVDVSRIKNILGILLILGFITYFIIVTDLNKLSLKSPARMSSALIIIWLFISRFHTQFPWSWEPEILRVVPLFLFFIFFSFFGSTLLFRQRIVNTIVILSSLLSAYGILQYFGIDFIQWGRPMRDGVFATFGHPNLFAPFLVLGVAASVQKLLDCPDKGKYPFLFLPLILNSFGLILTKSKGSFLGVIIAVITLCLFILPVKKKIFCIFLITAILVVSFAAYHLFPGPFDKFYDTNLFRIWTWKGAISIIKAQPWNTRLLGTGPGTFPILFPKYRDSGYIQRFRYAENLQHAHSEYLEITTESGFIGAALFLLFLAAYFLGIKKFSSRNKLDSWTKLSAGAVIAILVHNAVSVNLRWFSSLFLLLFIMGQTLPAKNEDRIQFNPQKQFSPTKLILIITFLFLGVVSLWKQITYFQSERLYFQAKVKLALDRKDQAIHILEQSVQHNPDNLPAQYDLAYAFSLNGQPLKAAPVYEFICSHNPNYQRVHRNLAICYHQIAQKVQDRQYYKKALAEMKKECALNDTDDNHFYLAQLYEINSDIPDMVSELKLYLHRILSSKQLVYRKKQQRTAADLTLVQPRNFTHADDQIKLALMKIRQYDRSNFPEFIQSLSRNYPDVFHPENWELN